MNEAHQRNHIVPVAVHILIPQLDAELEATFDKQKYLSVQDRMDLAQRMGLSDTQVKTWYQNRRTKWKRQAAVGMDLLNEASNVAAIQQLLRTNPYWANYMAANALNHPRLFPLQAA
ncbi:unnamed protein product, partial [Onchocerca ochengi]